MRQPKAPPVPANLLADCLQLPKKPSPFIDPERLIWEADVVYLYGECAGGKHALANAVRKQEP
jgi:hypothetical protein